MKMIKISNSFLYSPNKLKKIDLRKTNCGCKISSLLEINGDSGAILVNATPRRELAAAGKRQSAGRR